MSPRAARPPSPRWHRAVGSTLFALGVGVGALAATAQPARAWIPHPLRIAEWAAEGNRAAERTQILRLALAIRDVEGVLLARGTATVWPLGSARLELDPGVALRLLGELGAEPPLSEEPPEGILATLLLRPHVLLQADRPERVLRLLQALGGDPSVVDLGIEADRDCWVLGGRLLGSFAVNDRPALWFAIATRELLRVDAVRGFQYRLGPATSFGPLRWPAWYTVHPPLRAPLRVEVEALSAARRRGALDPAVQMRATAGAGGEAAPAAGEGGETPGGR